VFCLAKSDLLHLIDEFLVPGHRLSFGIEVFEEMVRKTQKQRDAQLEWRTNGGPAGSSSQDELSELASGISTLAALMRNDEKRDAVVTTVLSNLTGMLDEDELKMAEMSAKKANNRAALKVEGARLGHRVTGDSTSTRALEAKVAELQTSVGEMKMLLQQLVANSAAPAAAI
jgi:hypothetical protein